ncbi:Major facilitator superfamily multidrug transporter mdrA [Paramyrothecium foliicola]|nr:Major facilitator superfamily multidrug transporter mdrA [Paramyrothecium foliicola]
MVTQSFQPDIETITSNNVILDSKVLRIGPNELHISDVTAYKTIYSQLSPFPKHKDFYAAFNTPHTLFTEIEPAAHKVRRKMLSSPLSKIGVLKLEPVIQDKLNILGRKLALLPHNEPIDMYDALRLLTTEIIMQFAFARSANLIEADPNGFRSWFLDAFDLASISINDMQYRPIIQKYEQSQEYVAHLQMGQWANEPSITHPVLFDSLPGLTDKNLGDEAMDIMVAGADTTAFTLTTGLMYILQKPKVHHQLMEALLEAKSRHGGALGLMELERIDYLIQGAVVKESLRKASAVPGRLPRVVPEDLSKPLVVDGFVIPTGTIVSMSAYTMHTSADIWGPDALEYNPDRWLGPESKGLDQYLCAFSKGARMCIGQNLATAELTMALAWLFLNYDMKLPDSQFPPVSDRFTNAYLEPGVKVLIKPRRALARITVKPKPDLEIQQKPYLNDDGFVDFRQDDIEDPRTWSAARRWYITGVAVFLAFNGNVASSITSGSTNSITEEFGVSRVAASLTTTLFLLGYCAGPLVFAPLSEFYGRRWIFHATFLIYFAFTFLTAWPPNFGSLLVGRFLAGTFIAASLATAPGVLVDLWDSIDRGNAMAVYSGASWIGPALGPVLSGFFQLKKDWRWGMFACLWLGAFTIVLMLTIPETHSPTILQQNAKRARSQGYDVQSRGEANQPKLLHVYKTSMTRPWILLFDLISFLCCSYILVVFTLQFMLFSIYPIVFQDMRGWNAGVSQLPILGQAVGAVIGILIIFADTERRRKKAKSGGQLLPEDRMPLAMIGGVGFPIFMFCFCWSGQYNSVHWIVPTIGGALLGTSLMLVFVAYLNYVTDSYADYAASVLAANTVARSAGSAGAPLFTTQMFNALGVGGGGSLIAGIATLLAFIPFLFYRFGPLLRRKSKYALAEREVVDKLDEQADPTDFMGEDDGTVHPTELSIRRSEQQV